MKSFSSRQARRMMKRMGLSLDQMPDVEEVIIRTSTKEIVIEDPQVSVINMKGQKIFQVAGVVTEREKAEGVKPKVKIPDEDVQLVAQQAKVSLERARVALEETEGDLAQAILLLTQG